MVKVKRISTHFDPKADIDESFTSWIVKKIKKSFIDSIPMESVKEMPEQYMYFFGTLTHSFVTFCFIYFIYTGYFNARRQNFISLDSSSGQCSEVQAVVTGNHLADVNGYWSSLPEYTSSLALYEIKFANFQQTHSEFNFMLNDVREELDLLAMKSVHLDLASNALAWMTWTMRLKTKKSVNVFSMTGVPTEVFYRQYKFGLFTGVDGECEANVITEMDRANNLISLVYNINDFERDARCRKAVAPESWGYYVQYDFDRFSVDVDLRTLVVGVAVRTMTITMTHVVDSVQAYVPSIF
jgi:hypothetical protein